MKQLLSAILLLSFAATLPVLGQEATPLELDKPVERELAAGDKHTFEIVLGTNQFVYGEADQQTVDVIVTVYNHDGYPLETFDSPARGPEPFQFKSEREGTYRIEVAPFKEETGRYVMRLLRMEPVATTPEGQVDQLMAAYDRPGSPGCVCAVMKEGTIVHAKGYGMANLEYDMPLTPESVFYIASTSKQFTAASIALLVLDGTISLDDDIRTYLPEMSDFGKPITIRHLVHHTSGLRDYFSLLSLKGWRNTDYFDNDLVVELLAQQQELNFEPGSEYSYSNSGYVLLAEIVKRASGQTLRAFAEERLFSPLGMMHTHFDDDYRTVVKHRVSSYAHKEGGEYQRLLKEFDGHGDGNLLTTVGDLHRWDQNFYDPQVGGSAFIDLLLTRGVLTSSDTLDYAFGLIHGTYRDLPTVSHSGGFKGFRTQLLRFPKQRFSVAVLCNLASTNPTRLSQQVADIYLSEHFTEPEDEEIADPGREAVEIDPDLFDDYVGEYELQPGFILTITREDNRFFGQATGQSRFEIFPSSDSTFFLTVFEASLTFHRDPDGTVSRLTLHQGGDHVARRLQPYALTVEELAAYAGQYYSSELETTYTLDIEDGKLVVKHQRNEDFELKSLEKDKFGGTWPFREIVFQRDEAEQVTGIRVSSERLRNLLLERQE